MREKLFVLIKKGGIFIIAVAVVGGSFWLGFYFGDSRTNSGSADLITEVYNKTDSVAGAVDFDPFWQAWKVLDSKYVASHKNATTTAQDRVWGAIKGLAESYGDPYTTFFPPVEAKEFQNEISGNFEGLGMEVGMQDGIITIVAPLKDTPAYRAGIKSGDRIIKIDNKITTGMTVDEAVHLMRGPRGTSVTLTIMSKDAKLPKDITVVRDVINIPTLDTELRKDGVFVISLYNFSANSPTLFRDALKKFSESGSDKLILDMRGNPGGYLEAAVDMASWFLPAGKVVLREDTGGKQSEITYTSKGYDVFNENLKMMILVDGGSASAAEILAGALSEHNIAKLVGTKTFGKGSVQELSALTRDTSIKITVARWLTPNGLSISDQGLKPDYEVEFTQGDVDKNIDPQLNKAVELLLKK